MSIPYPRHALGHSPIVLSLRVYLAAHNASPLRDGQGRTPSPTMSLCCLVTHAMGKQPTEHTHTHTHTHTHRVSEGLLNLIFVHTSSGFDNEFAFGFRDLFQPPRQSPMQKQRTREFCDTYKPFLHAPGALWSVQMSIAETRNRLQLFQSIAAKKTTTSVLLQNLIEGSAQGLQQSIKA